MSITPSKSFTIQNEKPPINSPDDKNSSDKPQTGMTSKVVGGSFWTLIGQAVILGASLVFTPFVIRLLGTESYGVLALVNLLISYISFADFGMGTASTKFASEAYAEGNRENEAVIVWTALFIAFIPSVFFAGSLAMLSGYIVSDALRLPDYLQAAAAAALILASVGFVFRTASLVFNTPQLVRLRMDLVTLISAGTGLTQIVTVPLVILLGGGLVGAVATIAGFSFINLLCNVAVSRKLLPNLFNFKLQKTLTVPLIKYGGSLVLSSVAGMILVNLEKLVLTRYASVTVLAHYTIAFTLASMMTIVPNSLGQSLFPAFAQMQSEGNKENLLRLFIRAIRGNFIWVPPIIILLCFIAKPFFTIWAGEEFGRESVAPFYILAFGLAVNIIAYVPYNLVIAAGRADFLAKIYWAELIPYIFLTSVLTTKLGASGAALAWSIRVSVDTIIFLYLAKHILKQKISSFFDLNYAYLFAFMMLMIPCVFILAFSNSITVTLSSGGILMLLYGLIVWKTVLIDEERTWIKSQTSRFRLA
ncbi:MAG: flippase [Acidobacteriota bacterium]|nr:flippase [Acidobacteriota bacterium]